MYRTTLRLFLACLLLPVAGCSNNVPEETYDVLIINGTVHDGSLAAGQVANIGIRDERIVSISATADAVAATVIDATGLAVMPGFIDPHTHALPDLLEVETRANLNYLMQGVTTVFVGSDGAGMPDRAGRVNDMLTQGIGSNVAWFAGHNEIRRRVMGLENRAPTDAELAEMQRLLQVAMEAGALGLSTGLFYTPGSFATTAEVVEIARAMSNYNGVYDSHIRSESAFAEGLLAAVQEVVTIAEEAGVDVHISHLKALGRDVWGQSGDIIAMVDAARARGLNVTANQYPYRASGTRFSSALVPQWARADSREAMFARFENPDLADRLDEEMRDNLRIRGGPGAMLVTGSESRWRGKTLDEIAAEMQEENVLDAALEVIREGDPSIASFVMEEQDIHAIAIQPWVMTGSDGSPGHPRKYGTYPKVYRDMVLGAELLSLPQFVHRSSGLVADTFGLCDRGYLQVGRKADIVVLDLDQYAPKADFQNPEELAVGVRFALVNGSPVIIDGEFSGELPGEVIDRTALNCETG